MRRLELAAAAACVLMCVGGLAGCRATALDAAHQAYARGDYESALRQARTVAEARGAKADAAAYLAGLSAHRLNRLAEAETHLRAATRSPDMALAGDAWADLGLVHAQQGRYDQAATAFLLAADRSTGQNKANALYHAGLSQQKQGLGSAARANLALAKSHSRDPAFRQMADDALATGGYTVQIGAYAEQANAVKAGQALFARAASLKLGFPRVVASTDPQGRKLYLVQVGHFSTFELAEAWRPLLGGGGLVTPYHP